MNKKRILAYLLDILLLGLIAYIISLFIPTSQSIINLEKELVNADNEFFNGTINFQTYFNRYASINYDLEKLNLLERISDIVFIIIYFIGIPLNNNGQTIGQKLLKIKVVSNEGKLNFNQLLLKSFIINGLLFSLIAAASIYVLNDKIYFIFTSTLSFIQLGLLLATLLMMVNRKDKKGLQDLISKTSIEEVK